MMSTIEEGESSGVGDRDELLARRIFSKCPSFSLSRTERFAFNKHCIFRLPERFMKINDMSLKPQVVAIGPYCSQRNGQLQQMDEVKMQCLIYYLKVHTGTPQEYMVECLRQIRQCEDEIRGCYSESVNLNTDDLLQMMVVDGFFILYVLLYPQQFAADVHNPLYQLLEFEIMPKIYTDLLLLENQIPFIVLEKLYDMCIFKTRISLPELIARAISTILPIPARLVAGVGMSQPKRFLHLLNFVRLIFSHDYYDEKNDNYVPLSKKIPCVTKLSGVGIDVIRHMAYNFLEVNFNGVAIEMPELTLNNAMCSFLVNCVAFEQCYSCSTQHFSIYATFLDGLVKTEQDAEYLCDHHFIANSFWTNAEIAHFINNLSKDLRINLVKEEFRLMQLFEGVAKQYHQKNVDWTNIRQYLTNFKPWLRFSAFAGLLLFIVTSIVLQTIYTIFAYEHPKH